eukprot:Sspe_Gene.76228::Locus_47633_Transcript_1_1_Confidence_1.000_Length_1255::g.76228::m.76228/K05758/ARPC2; actin related protein 2/3 complex, subunit 2
MLLKGENQIVLKKVRQFLTGTWEGKPHTQFSDFNSTMWCYVKVEDTLYLGFSLVSISLKDLQKWGTLDHLKQIYGAEDVGASLIPGDYFQDATDYEVHVRITPQEKFQKPELTKAEEEELAAQCQKYAYLYQEVMTPIFKSAFTKINDGESFAPIRVPYRSKESFYLCSTKDNLCIHFPFYFESRDDQLFGRLFLQEFQFVRKQEKSLSAAPSCSYSATVPPDIKDVSGVESDEDHYKWITMVLFRKHTDTSPDVLRRTVEYLLLFVTYVNYQIQCSKAYMHTKMRSRHTQLLKVLNRAKTVQTDQAVAQFD